MTIYHDQDDERPERLGAVLDLRTSMIRASGGLAGGLPRRPTWAAHSVVEDGGVTHEFVSGRHPLTLRREGCNLRVSILIDGHSALVGARGRE